MSERIECTVRGSLRGGKAMCAYITVGCKYCSLKRGECNLQKDAEPGAADLKQPTTPTSAE